MEPRQALEIAEVPAPGEVRSSTRSTTRSRRSGDGGQPPTSGRNVTAELAYLPRALKAPSLAAAVERLAERARTESWTHEEFLAACLQREVAAREAHGGEGRIRAARFPARFPARKSLEDFDAEHQHSLKRETLAHLGTLDFITNRDNVVFLGPPGTGKTHLAIGLGVRACRAGHRTAFATAAEWVASSRTGYQKLITWAQSFPERTWAIEGAHGLGRHLAQFLVARGERVVDVPAFLSARVRELGRSGNRKTDKIDALATALAARDATDLHQVQPEDTTTVIAMLNERRDNLIAARTRTANQLHALLCDLTPGGLPVELTALRVARMLRSIRPEGLVAEQRKQLVDCHLEQTLRALG